MTNGLAAKYLARNAIVFVLADKPNLLHKCHVILPDAPCKNIAR
jgi:hypothetical protein